jgi:hypothetical protein
MSSIVRRRGDAGDSRVCVYCLAGRTWRVAEVRRRRASERTGVRRLNLQGQVRESTREGEGYCVSLAGI